MYLGETGKKIVATDDPPDFKLRKGPEYPESECTSSARQNELANPGYQCHNSSPLLQLQHMGSNSPCGRPVLYYMACQANR